MNIIANYQLKACDLQSRVNKQQLQTNPNFGMAKTQKLTKTILPAAMLTAATALAMLGVTNPKQDGVQIEQTKWGEVVYVPAKSDGTKAKLVVIRNNGMKDNIFEKISKETLQSPVMDHVHQANCSTINPFVGIELTQNESMPVKAQKVILKGTLENSMLKNNMTGIPAQFSNEQDSMFIETPWAPGIQQITGKCFMVTYGTVKEEWGALKDYCSKYADRKTGEAPDVAILASQEGTEDRSFMPADIAGKQYEIVTESGERIPCNYDEMIDGIEYKISKKAGVILKMAVPSEDVISSEGETLTAGKLYMVDSNGHFYNGQPIKRIKSGEVSWNADMNDPVQAQIRNDIDESLRLEAESKALKKEASVLNKKAENIRKHLNNKGTSPQNTVRLNAHTLKDLQLLKKLNARADKLKAKSNDLAAKAKQYTAKAEQEMTEWVKSAQNPEGASFFAE